MRAFGYVVEQWTVAMHTSSRIMMVVGWRIVPSSSMLTNIITVSHDHYYQHRFSFFLKDKKEIPDILWYMLILFDKITMDEDLERALVPILFCCSKLQQTYDGSHTLPVFLTKCTSLALPRELTMIPVWQLQLC